MNYEELIRDLREQATPCTNSGCIQTANDMLKAADAIEDLIKKLVIAEDESGLYDALPTVIIKEPQWISVEERLPEENGFYLCLYELRQKGGFGMDEALGILQFIDNKWSLFDNFVVTHWFPIPKLPKEET